MVVAPTGQELSVLEAGIVPEAAAGRIEEMIGRHGVGRVVWLTPARETVARSVAVPADSPDQISAAMALLAEAQLPESVPAHRRAWGLIPDRPQEGQRTGVLMAWRGSPPDLPPWSDGLSSWVAPLGALAMLRGGRGVAIHADPTTGAIEIVASGPERTVVRVLVEERDGRRFWEVAALAVRETCQAVGASEPQWLSVRDMSEAEAVLWLEASARAALSERVRGVEPEPRWLHRYGLCLGAAMVVLSGDPLIESLARMQAQAGPLREGVGERVVAWLARPRHAWSVAGVCVAAMLIVPLVLGHVRVTIVEARAEGLRDRLRDREATTLLLATIEQMDQSRWPMTKLLGDVARCTPVGVTIETLRLGVDQGLVLAGTVESLEVLNGFQAALGQSGVVGNVRINRLESTGSRVEFDLSADVLNPHAEVRSGEDYAAVPLAVRLYGEGASNTTRPLALGVERSGGRTARVGEGEPRRTSPPGSRAGEGTAETFDAGERGRGSGVRALPSPDDVPPPLSEDEIRRMDRATALREMVSRRTLSQRSGLDEGTRSRLRAEADRLRDQATRAPGGGGP